MKPVSQGTDFPYDAYTLNNVSEMAHFPKVLSIPESIPAASLVQDLLVRNFNEQTVPEVMCTNTVNVSWEGKMSPGPILTGKVSVERFDRFFSLNDEWN